MLTYGSFENLLYVVRLPVQLFHVIILRTIHLVKFYHRCHTNDNSVNTLKLKLAWIVSLCEIQFLFQSMKTTWWSESGFSKKTRIRILQMFCTAYPRWIRIRLYFRVGSIDKIVIIVIFILIIYGWIKIRFLLMAGSGSTPAGSVTHGHETTCFL